MRAKIFKQLMVLFAVGGIAFFLYYRYRVAPDVKLPELPLRDLNGQAVNLEQFKGKTLFINYWASWCGDCLGEMPSIEEAWLQSDTNKVVFLMISDESPEKIKTFLARHPYPMKFLRLEKRLQEIGVYTLPTTYLYNAEGEEILTRVGSVDWSDKGMIGVINGQ